MAYYNNSNKYGNGQVQTQDVWQIKHPVKILRWTKARSNRDGNGTNRGVEVQSTISGETRWVSLWSGNVLFKMLNWGSTCTYDPTVDTNNRLQIGNSQPPTNQAQADYFSRQAEFVPQQSVYEQIEQGYHPQNQQTEIQYDNHLSQNGDEPVQPREGSDNLNEAYLNKISMLMSMCLAMAEDICPQGYTSEQKQKVGTTLFLQYTKDIHTDIPF